MLLVVVAPAAKHPPGQNPLSIAALSPVSHRRRANRLQMTKQKIVIKLSMPTAKSRSKAMTLAARTHGVSSMAISGDGKDQLEVVGEGVDTVCLVSCLRKKVGHAVILKVEEVKDKKKPEDPPPHWWPGYYYHKKKPEDPEDPPPHWWPGYYYHHPPPAGMVVCEEPSIGCHIM